MTITERPPPCDCYEVGYSLGQYQALADYIDRIKDDPRHAKRCRCATCYIRKGWDEIQKTGTDKETLTKKMPELAKELQKFLR